MTITEIHDPLPQYNADDTFRQTGLCTCCEKPRAAHRDLPVTETDGCLHPDWDALVEWGHDDDNTFADMRHIHIDTQSRDCDGRYDRSHIHTPGKPWRDDDPGDFQQLWRTTAHWTLPIGHWHEAAEIKVEEGRISWWLRTDEGGESGVMVACEQDHCAHDAATFRDHTAEAAGY